jgi:long-chain acyl-CoA synthetase
MGRSGKATPVETYETTPRTIPAFFLETVARRGSEPAIDVPIDGEYSSVSWQSLAERIAREVALLRAVGVRHGDCVAQVSDNRLEWIVTDLAILLLGAVHVPIHATLSGPQIAYQIVDSRSKVVFLAGRAQAELLAPLADQLGGARYFCYDDWPDRVESPLRIEPLTQAMEKLGDGGAAATWPSELLAVEETALATILYTSGTTGAPKGVMLSQRNLASNAAAVCNTWEQHDDELRLGFLPLSHVYARTCDLYTWIVQGTRLALASHRDAVLENCRQVRPTLLNGVPYFYEKVSRVLQSGGVPPPGGLREVLGGRIRTCCCGGAALADDVARFFHSQGVCLVQGYGLSESSPVISFCTPDDCKIGSVGRPIPGIEVRIAEDGEILTRGPHVMLGYWRDEKSTAETIRDGWLHTGDLGELDGDGHLYIRGRKKEILVTATGKNVVPGYLENLLTGSPFIAQAVVFGDARKYLVALVVPDFDHLKESLARRAACENVAQSALTEWSRDPQVLELFRREIDHRLAALSHHEQIGRFALIERPLTIEQGELTAKLSLRREVFAEHFSAEIASLYLPNDPS